MDDSTSLQNKLETYEKNLQKVNELLNDNKTDENLLKIRQDLVKVIDLTQTLIKVSTPLITGFPHPYWGVWWALFLFVLY